MRIYDKGGRGRRADRKGWDAKTWTQLVVVDMGQARAWMSSWDINISTSTGSITIIAFPAEHIGIVAKQKKALGHFTCLLVSYRGFQLFNGRNYSFSISITPPTLIPEWSISTRQVIRCTINACQGAGDGAYRSNRGIYGFDFLQTESFGWMVVPLFQVIVISRQEYC